jgi:hypothetical protein
MPGLLNSISAAPSQSIRLYRHEQRPSDVGCAEQLDGVDDMSVTRFKLGEVLQQAEEPEVKLYVIPNHAFSLVGGSRRREVRGAVLQLLAPLYILSSEVQA